MPAAMSDVLREVAAERAAQDARWGEQNHPDGTGQWVHEQTSADLARESCQKAAAAGEVTWRHILREEYYEALAESVPGRLRAELLQVAAVAVAWIEAIDRRRHLADYLETVGPDGPDVTTGRWPAREQAVVRAAIAWRRSGDTADGHRLAEGALIEAVDALPHAGESQAGEGDGT